MKLCYKQGCLNKIPSHIIIDGKFINLQRRKFCFVCSPFKSHNCRDLNKILIPKSSYVHVKKFRHRKKQKAIDYKGGKCQLCGYNRCNSALIFHHLNPSEKKYTIAESKSWGFDRIKPELDKCILLCHNCHSEVHEGLVELKK